MRAIVTGGAGFVGSNLVGLLVKKKWEVLVVDDFSVGSRDKLPKSSRLKIVKSDVRNQASMKKIIRNADVVFHLAVQCVRKSLHDPWLVHDVNAGGTLNVLDAAYQNKVRKFIYISSSEAYGSAETVPMDEAHPLNPTTMYGATKAAGELYAMSYFRTYGYNTMVVRPFNMYGYNSHFAGPYGEVIPRFVIRVLNDLAPQVTGDGSQTRDFTFIEDATRGMWEVYKKGKAGQVYNIARGEEVTINDIAKKIITILGKNLEVEYTPGRPGDVMRHYASIKKSESDIGFKPKINIDKGLKKYINWFTKKYKDYPKLMKNYETKNW